MLITLNSFSKGIIRRNGLLVVVLGALLTLLLFSIGKEERAATEGIANPAFNISSTDLSAYQTSEEEVIRCDKQDSTLAAHQQKLRLQARAESRGETSLSIIITLSDSGYVLDLTCAFHGLYQTLHPNTFQ